MRILFGSLLLIESGAILAVALILLVTGHQLIAVVFFACFVSVGARAIEVISDNGGSKR